MAELHPSPAPAACSPSPGGSLGDAHASIPVPRGHWLRRFLAFSGPGYMVSVGYMDPGNWATDLAAGSRFGYRLLVVVLAANLMAILLQALCARLGIATGRDLAQCCRDRFPPAINVALWLACEVAIIACDLAEVIGTAIALQLLFGLPLLAGAALSALDAFLLLVLVHRGFRFLEAFVIALLAVIMVCFAVQIAALSPPIAAILDGLLPRPGIATEPETLYVAIGILGATVMPHNLYLHSATVQTRAFERTEAGRREALRFATWDSTLALSIAFWVNAAILVLAAGAFHASGHTGVAEIGQAYDLLSPVLGVAAASTLFAVALLASGINSTVTATLAGQIVMEGFLDLRLPPLARRLLTRGLAIVPVLAVTWYSGESGTAQLLVLSQVVLSMQLPFAVVPLILFVRDRRLMGRFAISGRLAALCWAVAALIVVLNATLVWQTLAPG